MSFFKKSKLHVRQVPEGITLQSVSGKGAMMTFLDFGPNAVIPMHKHPHEQITFIIDGTMEFTLEGETRILNAGKGVLIAPDLDHGARTFSKPARAVNAWYPLRQDYIIR